MDFLRVLYFLPLLLLLTDATPDIDDKNTIAGWDFIYHDSHNLLLTIANDSCYFTSLRNIHASETLNTLNRDRTERMVYQLITTHPGRAIKSSLTTARVLFHDLLADFHCVDKQVYLLTLKGDDFIRAGILHEYVVPDDSSA